MFARLLADLDHRHIWSCAIMVLLVVGTSIAAAFVATYRMERACAMQLAFQQSGAAFHPIADEVVTAAYNLFPRGFGPCPRSRDRRHRRSLAGHAG
jgi:hypothetical protein